MNKNLDVQFIWIWGHLMHQTHHRVVVRLGWVIQELTIMVRIYQGH